MPLSADDYRKLDEQPYDFLRKRLSVLVRKDACPPVLICKGALAAILELCTDSELESGQVVPLAELRPAIEAQFAQASGDGNATASNSDQSQIFDAAILLENFMRKAHHRAIYFRGGHQLRLLRQC